MKISNIKTLIPQIELNESTYSSKKPVSEIEVMHAGKWEHAQYGTVEITEADIDKFLESFNNKVRKIELAVDQEHMPEKGAAGWFKELQKIVEDGKIKLKAIVEWTALGKQLIQDGVFKYFSPEFDFEYEDPESHEVTSNVLIGGALTNRPYFKSLAPVALSEYMFAGFKGGEIKMEKCPKCNKEVKKEEMANHMKTLHPLKGGEKSMNKEELKAKLVADSEFKLSETATDEEKKLFSEVKAEIEAENAEKAEKEKKEKEGIKGSENFISKADHEREMNEVKSKMGVLEAKLRFTEVQKEVKGYVFSESNPDGVILPKNTDKAEKLLMAAGPKVTQLFKEFMAELPKVSAKLFKEEGSGGNEGQNKAEMIATEAQKMVDEKKVATYSEGIKQLQREKPELFK